VANKIDLLGVQPSWPPNILPLSAKEQLGLSKLREAILTHLHALQAGSETLLSHARHQESFLRAEKAISGALALLKEGGGTELIAEELRTAQAAIGEITGEITPDEILGEIFSRFCIGK
jgi:tRNA modification GTPase